MLIDRELLKELASFCSDSRSYNEAMRVLAATPTPILDTGELERLVTEQVKHAYYERKTITEAVGEIVSALQADHIEHVRAMVVPDGWQLVPVEPTEDMQAAGQASGKNCAFSYAACYRAMLAASSAPGGDV